MPRFGLLSRPRSRLLAAVATGLVLVSGVVAGVVGLHAEPAGPGLATSVVTLAPSSAATRPGTDPDQRLADVLEPFAGEGAGRLSVAVLDPATGSQAVYGEAAYDTASIVKVNILVALLLQTHDEGRKLTAQEDAHASAMIGTSDNAAATALWNGIGGAQGLDAANRRLGLTGTTGGTDGQWGLTQTTAEDQLRLLGAVFAADSVLTESAQEYVQGLMGSIADDQDWGVSAAGTAAALKNGWLPRSGTGLWDVNSIGQVQVGGRDYLVAVLSDGNSTQEAGIARVEDAARVAVTAMHSAH
ncbi:serine hydrolase [Streptomyces sp. SYSU K21746]